MIILLFVYEFMWVYLGFYIHTIGDMQNEKDYLYHYKMFEYTHDFLKDFWKIDDAKDLHLVWDDNVYLYLKVYYKFLLLVYLFD